MRSVLNKDVIGRLTADSAEVYNEMKKKIEIFYRIDILLIDGITCNAGKISKKIKNSKDFQLSLKFFRKKFKTKMKYL